jgi:transcriptional regulator with XRE-family HTH domain
MEVEVLGSELREARLRKELSLDEVEQELRIRAKFLAAIETGDYSLIPSQVQARGFLRNYAQFLGLDADAILARYEQAMGQPEAFGYNGHLPKPMPVVVAKPSESDQRAGPVPGSEGTPGPDIGRTSRRRRAFSSSMVVFGLTAVLMFFVLAWGGTQLIEWLIDTDNRAEGVDFIESVLGDQPTVTPSATFVPSPSPTAGVVIPEQQMFNSVFVILNVTQRTWARITVDGEVQFQGIAVPGTRLQYQGASAVQVRAGNAAGLEAVVNDQVIGPLGQRGQVVDVSFTLDGLQTQTPGEETGIPPATPNPVEALPAITPTPTQTPQPPMGDAIGEITT